MKVYFNQSLLKQDVYGHDFSILYMEDIRSEEIYHL